MTVTGCVINEQVNESLACYKSALIDLETLITKRATRGKYLIVKCMVFTGLTIKCTA